MGFAYKTHPSGIGGIRHDLGGLYFRSKMEANYARYLNWLIENKQILKWEYEPDEFEFVKIKRGNRTYKPDFKVWLSKDKFEYHEVKGWMDSDSKIKLSRMQKFYPEIKIVLIDSPVYSDIRRKVSKLIKNWE